MFTKRAFLAFFFLLSCQNIYKGISEPAAAQTEGEDYESLIELGNNAMNTGEYENALVYFQAASAEDPNSAEARLGISRAVILRDRPELLNAFSEVLVGMEGANILTLFIGTANENSLFSAEGALNINNKALNETGYSLIEGELDDSVESDSFTANFHYLYTYMIYLPVMMFDSSRDSVYANGDDPLDSGGDLIIMSNSNFTTHPDVDNLSSLITNLEIEGDAFSNVAALISLDQNLKAIHDSLEFSVIANLAGFNFFERLDSASIALSNIQNSSLGTSLLGDNAESLSMITNLAALFSSQSNLAGLLDGSYLNPLHSNLNGNWAFDNDLGISSYVRSDWIDLTNLSDAGSTNNLQSQLKVMYDIFTNLPSPNVTNISNELVFFTNSLTNFDFSALTNLSGGS